MRDKTDRFLDSMIVSSFTIVVLYVLRFLFFYLMKEEYFEHFDNIAFIVGGFFLIFTIFFSLKRFEDRQRRD